MRDARVRGSVEDLMEVGNVKREKRATLRRRSGNGWENELDGECE